MSSNLNPSPNPVVSIKRIPALDEAALASLSTKNVLATSATILSCFLCCEVTLLASLTQGRRHYLRQVQLFKTHLPHNGNGKEGVDDRVETCAKCLQDVKQVWELNQQIEAIKEDIDTIVTRVVALKQKKDGGKSDSGPSRNKKRDDKIRSSGCLCSNPEIAQSKDGTNEEVASGGPETQPVRPPAIETNDPIFEDVKEEPAWAWSGDEDDNYAPDEESYFEKADITASPCQTEQNIPEEVDPGSGVASSFPLPDSSLKLNNSLRPKRKSGIRAEELLHQTLSSETNEDKISDDDDDSEYEGGDPLAISEPEQEAESESEVTEGPPKKKTKTDTKALVPCPHCEKQYLGANNLRVHIRSQHLGHRYKCEFCEKSFTDTNQRKQHTNFIHKGVTFPCSLCSKVLSTRKSWAFHEAMVCMVPDKGWGPEKLKKEFNITLRPCPIEGCGKLLHKQTNLKSHLATHAGLRPHLCSRCGEAFTQIGALKRHSETVCGPGVTPELRLKHVTRDREYKKREKPFSCRLCMPIKRFTKVVNLNKHNLQCHPLSIRSNSGIPPADTMPPIRVRDIPCPQCDSKFFTALEMGRHVTKYHTEKEEDGQRKHKCKDCGIGYRYRSNLSEHRSIVHPDAVTKKFACDKCPRRFFKPIDLQKHLDIHAKYGW